MRRRPNRIALITTVSMTLETILQKPVERLLGEGFEVHTICSPVAAIRGGIAPRPGLFPHAVAMRRRIHPIADAVSLARLWRLLRRIAPVAVQTHTPKAGLLGMIAAWANRVPVRIYTINGLPSETLTGWQQTLVRMADRLACWLATDVLCVSPSLRGSVIAQRICSQEKVRTLGYGGSHGVDLTAFDPDVCGREAGLAVRRRYGIDAAACVIGYVGRIVRDKGIVELSRTWEHLASVFPNAHLLLCGVMEPEDPLPFDCIARLRAHPRVHFTGSMVADMPPVYAAMDICVLPSYREGLPNVALEAAAMRVPIVATKIAGCVDAVAYGVTGLLVESRDAGALGDALASLLRDAELRHRMGQSAREFVAERFDQDHVCSLWAAEYRRLLEAHGYTRLQAMRATTGR